MDGPRDDFLPRTAFPSNKYASVSVGHALDDLKQLLHRRTVADDAQKACLGVFALRRLRHFEMGANALCQRTPNRR
jgi:hypothetical protein